MSLEPVFAASCSRYCICPPMCGVNRSFPAKRWHRIRSGRLVSFERYSLRATCPTKADPPSHSIEIAKKSYVYHPTPRSRLYGPTTSCPPRSPTCPSLARSPLSHAYPRPCSCVDPFYPYRPRTLGRRTIVVQKNRTRMSTVKSAKCKEKGKE